MPGSHCLFLLEQFRVVLHLILLPFPEVFGEVIVVLLTDHVLLHAFEALDLLVDGAGVEIDHIQYHACRCTIRAQGSHVFVHVSDQNSLRILELQPREGNNRSKPHLYVLLDRQNGLIEVIACLNDLERADVMLDGQFDGGVLHECLHLKIFKLYFFLFELLMQEQSITRPLPVDKLAPRQLLRQQLILQKFLKHLNNNTLPTLHDDNALKVTRMQNQLLEENISAFREGRYEAYLAGKVEALRKEVQEKSKLVNSTYSY